MNKLSLDSHKLVHHLPKLNSWLKGEFIYPMYVAISPTANCNHKCIFCAYEYIENDPVYLEKGRAEKIITEFARLGVKSILFSGEGEPFLNKSFPEIIRHTKSVGIDTAVNTNGVLISREIAEGILPSLTYIRISINGGSKETYSRIHGCRADDFDRVIRNLEGMAEEKNKKGLDVTIGTQCLLLAENMHEIPALAKILRDTGVDYLSVKPFLQHPKIGYRPSFDSAHGDFESLMKEAEEVSTDSFKVIVRRRSLEKVKGRSYDQCLSLPFMIEIDSKGDVYPCGPFLGYPEMVYGNIYRQSFKELWTSKKCRDLVSRLTTEFNVHECMPNCRNDEINRFLWDLKHPPDHVNFI